jgi:outer membrane immunogenic protein
MKKVLLASAAILAMAGVASAADMRMPVKAPPVIAPVFSWTGCYIGGYVGGAWAANDAATYELFDGVGGYGVNHAGGATTYRAWSYKTDSSFIGGGTVGCNWQPVGSPFVLGLEGEIGYLNIEGSALDPFQAAPLTYGSATKIGDWYGMITGRLGYSWDRAMIYVKGGAAFVNVESSVYDAAPIGLAPWSLTTSETVATWTVGGGIEWAFDMNWSIKAEYMYIGLNGTQGIASALPGDLANHYWDNDISGIHTAKVGLNYRFGGGAPVMARY